MIYIAVHYMLQLIRLIPVLFSLLLYAVLLYFNITVLTQLAKCDDKKKSVIRSHAIGYLGTTVGIGALLVIIGVATLIVRLPIWGPVAIFGAKIFDVIGLTLLNQIIMIVIGALYLTFNAVILADVNQCKDGKKVTSYAVTITVIACLVVMMGYTGFKSLGAQAKQSHYNRPTRPLG